MSADDALGAHRRKLAEKFPVYQLFDPLEQCDLSDETVAAIREQLGRLTELVLSNGLRTRPEAVPAVDSFVRLPDPEARDVFAAWLATVEAAGTSPRAMQLLLDSFGSWVVSTRPGIRAAFLEALPELARHTLDLRGEPRTVAGQPICRAPRPHRWSLTRRWWSRWGD